MDSSNTLDLMLNFLFNYKWVILLVGYALAFVAFIIFVNNSLKKDEEKRKNK